MSTTHDAQCPPCMHEEGIQKGRDAWSAMFVNGHPKGSVMVRISAVEGQVEAFDDKFDRLQDSIDKLPNKILTWVLVIGGLLVILQFLGPSIKKAMGMAATQSPSIYAQERPQISTIPNTR